MLEQASENAEALLAALKRELVTPPGDELFCFIEAKELSFHKRIEILPPVFPIPQRHEARIDRAPTSSTGLFFDSLERREEFPEP